MVARANQDSIAQLVTLKLMIARLVSIAMKLSRPPSLISAKRASIVRVRPTLGPLLMKVVLVDSVPKVIIAPRDPLLLSSATLEPTLQQRETPRPMTALIASLESIVTQLVLML